MYFRRFTKIFSKICDMNIQILNNVLKNPMMWDKNDIPVGNTCKTYAWILF